MIFERATTLLQVTTTTADNPRHAWKRPRNHYRPRPPRKPPTGTHSVKRVPELDNRARVSRGRSPVSVGRAAHRPCHARSGEALERLLDGHVRSSRLPRPRHPRSRRPVALTTGGVSNGSRVRRGDVATLDPAARRPARSRRRRRHRAEPAALSGRSRRAPGTAGGRGTPRSRSLCSACPRASTRRRRGCRGRCRPLRMRARDLRRCPPW
jgi:hypothetical protein